MHSRINQSIATDCRTFWPRRPSSTYQTVCTQLTKAYMILLCIRMFIKIDICHLLFGSVHSQPYPMHCSATAFWQLTLFLLDSICNSVCRPDQWFQACKQCDMSYAKHRKSPHYWLLHRDSRHTVWSGVIFCTQTYRIERSTGYYMSSLLYCMFTVLNLASHAVNAIYIPLLCV